MAWYCAYLPDFNIKLFNWTVILLLGFEIAYIALQAGRGQLSHYNMSTPFYATLFSMMAIAASVVTIYTAYVGGLFFSNNFENLPIYYVWSIRLAMVLFVIFSFEGFAMGARLSHTVGAASIAHGLILSIEEHQTYHRVFLAVCIIGIDHTIAGFEREAIVLSGLSSNTIQKNTIAELSIFVFDCPPE